MDLTPTPHAVSAEAARLVEGTLQKVPLACADLRDTVVAAVGALLHQRTDTTKAWTPERIALRCVHLANFSYDKAKSEQRDPGESLIRNARDWFRSRAITKFFP